MSYSVKKRKIGYCVIEKYTNITLAIFDNHTEARALSRSLNLGSGFNGYSPSFFKMWDYTNNDTTQIERPTRV